ncbi:hypothetical protein B566_EDAN011120 [Ephemera danica]|nr:hypothetical protein B566_EDAN011120 [Ephemera danica]
MAMLKTFTVWSEAAYNCGALLFVLVRLSNVGGQMARSALRTIAVEIVVATPMAFYFEYKIQNPKADVIHNNVALHPQFPLLAVASYGEEKGGFVTLHNDEVLIAFYVSAKLI